MMSFSFSFDNASAGRIQNGWIKSFHELPSMTAVAVWPPDAPLALAASIMNGPWITQWPPPDGAKKLMKNELIKPQNGKVCGVAILTKTSENVLTRPDDAMIAMMPA